MAAAASIYGEDTIRINLLIEDPELVAIFDPIPIKKRAEYARKMIAQAHAITQYQLLTENSVAPLVSVSVKRAEPTGSATESDASADVDAMVEGGLGDLF